MRYIYKLIKKKPVRTPVSNMEFEFEMYEFTNEQLKGNITLKKKYQFFSN